MSSKPDERSCCRISVDNARRRWKACGDALSQEIADQIKRLEEKNAELLGVIRKVEWDDRSSECPACKHQEYEGHADDCPIKKALA